MGKILIGTAGWQIPAASRSAFPSSGTSLARYAARLSAVEINSTFRRSHRLVTYSRWAASVPDGFRFAAKLPETISHTLRLRGCREPLSAFLSEVSHLGDKLGCLLLQLPPSLCWDGRVANGFLRTFRAQFDGAIVVEPRHPSWFTQHVNETLARYRVSRAAADPAVVAMAATPGGDGHFVYFRLHGSPRMYYSSYDDHYVVTLASQLRALAQSGHCVWCIFDNTAAGCALANAVYLSDRLQGTDRKANARSIRTRTRARDR